MTNRSDGFILVRADFAEPIHRQIYEQLEEVFADEGNPGNNLLPRIPQIKQVFDHPAVAGALTSLLGPGYIMNPPRHCPLNPPGGKGQSWHKDCYVFDHNTRHPRFHWILALYYPQDTTADMGPTAILPRPSRPEGTVPPVFRTCTFYLDVCIIIGVTFLSIQPPIDASMQPFHP